MNKAKKVLVIGVLPASLVNFRGDLIKAILSAGHEVVALSEPTDDVTVSQIAGMGVKHHAYPVQRNALNPWHDIRTLVALYKAIKQEDADVILAYTIKPIIWGGLANLICHHTKFFALVTGLGYAFQRGGFWRYSLNLLVRNLYKVALWRASKVIFQNPDNRDVFVHHGIVRPEKCSLVNGSGVDIYRFPFSPPPAQGQVFLCISRLLGDKGLREYAAAAELVKQRYPNALFRLVGPEDPSPDGIALDEVKRWQATGYFQYCGSTDDVLPYLQGCHVYVLPSYHEGLPRTVIEAMAVGRAVITTDAPGCRETVVDELNGYLVPVREVQRLAQAMCRFIEDPELAVTMGQRSREIVEEKFDVRKVNNVMMREMGLSPSL